MLQIRRNRDNLGIIFHVAVKNTCCDTSLKPSCQVVLMRGKIYVFIEKLEKLSKSSAPDEKG